MQESGGPEYGLISHDQVIADRARVVLLHRATADTVL
jgi:hypothetical protein